MGGVRTLKRYQSLGDDLRLCCRIERHADTHTLAVRRSATHDDPPHRGHPLRGYAEHGHWVRRKDLTSV